MENDIEIILDLNNIPDIMLDEAEFRQLILNLVRNGVEAMSPGSKMTIKTYNDSNGVTLAIQDQGHGMTPEVVEKLGTPFFTTKPHGNGLGLPVCFSIAGRHNARIEVETSPAGTIFKVKFPGSTCSGD